MSRATSGLAISDESSAIRFSSADISASIVSGWRGFLIILTRQDSLAGAADRNLLFRPGDPSANPDCADLVFLPPRPTVNADFTPAFAVLADPACVSFSPPSPFNRAA